MVIGSATELNTNKESNQQSTNECTALDIEHWDAKKKSNSLLADCSVKTVSALQNVFLMHFENTA